MTELLGYLMWWKIVGQVDMTFDDLAGLVADTEAVPHHRPIPADVFRRICGMTKAYPLDSPPSPLGSGATLEMSLHKVDAKVSSMMARHMVATVRNDANVVQAVAKAGDLAFYKPPRGQHSKARLRVVALGGPYAEQASDFARDIRAEYDRGVKGAVDSQAVRRVIRAYLAAQGAIYLDGPYFMKDEAQCAGLERLFSALGGGSFMHVVPLLDSPEQRAFVERYTEEASA